MDYSMFLSAYDKELFSRDKLTQAFILIQILNFCVCVQCSIRDST